MAEPQVELDAKTAELDLITRAARKEEAAVRDIVRQYNRRLYRVARSILKDDREAEDALQEAYMRAFAALGSFRRESSLATWLTRIVYNEALDRLRRRHDVITSPDEPFRGRGADVIPFPTSGNANLDPEQSMAQREIIQLLEKAIDELPDAFRTVLVARIVEGMSVEETAELLSLRPETVKTRLHRARGLLRNKLASHIGSLFDDAFPFAGKRCDRMTETVVARVFTRD
jgi:RNA polymerase sigma-70 factor (ECF subfamily)